MSGGWIIALLCGVVAIPFVVYAVSWVLALTSRDNWTIPTQSDDDFDEMTK